MMLIRISALQTVMERL